jgi:hypothetical protein
MGAVARTPLTVTVRVLAPGSMALGTFTLTLVSVKSKASEPWPTEPPSPKLTTG